MRIYIRIEMKAYGWHVTTTYTQVQQKHTQLMIVLRKNTQYTYELSSVYMYKQYMYIVCVRWLSKDVSKTSKTMINYCPS